MAALEAEGDGDAATAESGYRAVLRAEEDFLPARLGLARALVVQQDADEAIAVLSVAPFDAEAVEARGRLLLSLDRFEEAGTAFARLERLAPGSAEVLLLQAEALAHTRPRAARQRLEDWLGHPSVSGIDASGARVAVLVADALREAEDEDEAQQLLESLSAASGAEEHEILRERLDRYQVEKAARMLARGGSEPLPADVRGRLERARTSFAAGDVTLARKELAPLVRAHPRSAELLATWAAVSAETGEVAEAERALHAAMALEPLDAAYAAALGRLLLEHYGGLHAREAAGHLERAVRLRPGSGDLWLSLADARWQGGQLDAAARAYAGAVQRGETAERAVARQTPGPEREAFPAPVELDERELSLPLGYWVARVYAAAGRTDEALAELATLRNEGEEGPEVAELEASLALAAGELPRAETLYREALAARPSEPRLLVGLGDVLLLQGREAEALVLLERAAGLPGGASAWLPLARHRYEAWKPWEAEAQVERFLAGAGAGPQLDEALALKADILLRQRQIRSAAVLGGVGLLLLPLGVWAARRRGGSVEELLARSPDAFRDLAPVLSALRHEVLKHNTSLLEPLADAVERGDDALVAWASERLFGEQGVVERFREHTARIAAIGQRHGMVLNLVRQDPLFAPALAAVTRLAGLQRDLDRMQPRAAQGLREVAEVLNGDTYRGIGALLARGQCVAITDELVARAWDAVQAEPARRDAPRLPLGIDLPEGLYVRGSHRDLHDVLANLFRNALQAGATRVAVRTSVVEDWITGLESVVVRVADDAPGKVSTAQIRSRFIERGLGLVVDLVHRFGGSVSVVDEPGFEKAIALTLPRTEIPGDVP